MRLIAVRPSRLYCATCEEVFNLPQVRAGPFDCILFCMHFGNKPRRSIRGVEIGVLLLGSQVQVYCLPVPIQGFWSSILDGTAAIEMVASMTRSAYDCTVPMLLMMLHGSARGRRVRARSACFLVSAVCRQRREGRSSCTRAWPVHCAAMSCCCSLWAVQTARASPCAPSATTTLWRALPAW